jgi:hypothetical protein
MGHDGSSALDAECVELVIMSGAQSSNKDNTEKDSLRKFEVLFEVTPQSNSKAGTAMIKSLVDAGWEMGGDGHRDTPGIPQYGTWNQ